MFAIGDLKWPGLSKVIEETGELLQVIGRLIATHGETRHYSGADLMSDYLKEIADVAAAVEFVVGFLTPEQRATVSARKRMKLSLFQRWHWENFPSGTNGQCQHKHTQPGKNSPRRYGSYATEVCIDCGAFRTHGHDPGRSNMSGWRPASEYEAETADTDEEG